MKKLNLFFSLVALALVFISSLRSGNLNLRDIQHFLFDSSPEKEFDFEEFNALVKKKLDQKYVRPQEIEIDGLTGISFEEYINIKYKPEVAIWKNLGLPFQLQFFHPGHLYSDGVKVFEIIDNQPREINYDASRFDFGNLKLSGDFSEKTKSLHYTGFRIHYPINDPNHLEEFCVFQGGSYFRLISKGQVYGLSARGLSINTALTEKEEFPKFAEFYIKRPKPDDSEIQVFAKLESESVLGAYEFIIKPGDVTKAIVNARIYLRKKIKRLGIAPLTSMFLYGESDKQIRNNFHPEIHDSDGLLIQTESDEWEWRPLLNPKKTGAPSEIPINNVKGYGLMQRDRKFKNYQDEFFKYHLRPSIWVRPLSGFERGRIYLYEWSTELDSDDNVGVFFEPLTPPILKEPFSFSYELSLYEKSPPEHSLGKVSSFYKGFDPKTPNLNTYTIYFTGEILKRLSKEFPPKVQIQNSEIPRDQIVYKLEKIRELDQWRLVFTFPPYEGKSEWQIQLLNGEEKISEKWIYRDGISK
ncbi:MAG: glucan biosynthesis protein [Leptospira sp.]|nr:glucan biosynthesis protein [Leptospira sp.]